MPAPRNEISSSVLDVARRERAELVVDLLLGQPGVERQRVGGAADRRECRANRSSIRSTPIAASISRAVGVGGGGVLAHNSVAS